MPIPASGLGVSTLDALVVDDDEEVRELLCEHLRARGIRVSAAGDGRAALTAIQRSSAGFGLVFTDLHLPGADGMTVLQAAKTTNASAYVVIITGYATLDSAIQAVRLGAYDYLTKPFSLGQIDVLLRRVEDRVSLEAENRQLLRRIDAQEASASRSGASDRLATIELRLASIEAAMRDLTQELSRRRL
jgi:DNA-binding NtrC family response regulator